MLKNILKSLQDAGDVVREKATEFNESAREKIISGIEEWVEILPKIKALGFEMTSFGISMGLSPCMSAEFKGSAEKFSDDKIKALSEENKTSKPLKLFLNVLKMTLLLHEKSKAKLEEDLYVRIDVKLSPEIKVYIGRPNII